MHGDGGGCFVYLAEVFDKLCLVALPKYFGSVVGEQVVKLRLIGGAYAVCGWGWLVAFCLVLHFVKGFIGASHCRTRHSQVGNEMIEFLKLLASLGLELTSIEYTT